MEDPYDPTDDDFKPQKKSAEDRTKDKYAEQTAGFDCKA
jgi:hypothetical protein